MPATLILLWRLLRTCRELVCFVFFLTETPSAELIFLLVQREHLNDWNTTVPTHWPVDPCPDSSNIIETFRSPTWQIRFPQISGGPWAKWSCQTTFKSMKVLLCFHLPPQPPPFFIYLNLQPHVGTLTCSGSLLNHCLSVWVRQNDGALPHVVHHWARCSSVLSRVRGNPSVLLPVRFISHCKWTCVLPCHLIFIHSGGTLSLCAKGYPSVILPLSPPVSPIMSQLRCVYVGSCSRSPSIISL